ncbi:hypothetical protein J6590_009174 [Homalodisca vitripennis]|nr:hypothetical protein J6590_009174 [Homalodisca vitripennis]
MHSVEFIYKIASKLRTSNEAAQCKPTIRGTRRLHSPAIYRKVSEAPPLLVLYRTDHSVSAIYWIVRTAKMDKVQSNNGTGSGVSRVEVVERERESERESARKGAAWSRAAADKRGCLIYQQVETSAFDKSKRVWGCDATVSATESARTSSLIFFYTFHVSSSISVLNMTLTSLVSLAHYCKNKDL